MDYLSNIGIRVVKDTISAITDIGRNERGTLIKVNNWHLFIGAILSMLGAYFIVVDQNNITGNIVLGLSNIFLLWYAIGALMEFFRKMLLTTDESSPEKE